MSPLCLHACASAHAWRQRGDNLSKNCDCHSTHLMSDYMLVKFHENILIFN
jgi:hypothetical protein